MDFVHFLKSQRYRSRVPLRQLQFTVAVYRAIVVEEANVELLTEVVVPWDGKVFSPHETLDLYKDLTELTMRPTTAAGELHTLTAPGESAAATATINSPLSATAATAALGINTSGTTVGASASREQPASASPPNALALPSPRELAAQLRRPQSSFFTRPSLEDFIDRAEEDFPVDPPQGPSLLAPIILRQHRRDHQPNRKMFLMWASGDVVLPDENASNQVGSPPLRSTTAAAASGDTAGAKDAFAPAASTLPAIEVSAMAWKGVERVLCTLTAEVDEHVFTTRPSLNDVHTLFVDAAHIYTFRVTVSRAEAATTTTPGNPALSERLQTSLDTSAAPLDVVLANVRELSQYTEEQLELLEVSRDAVARRLLRQAALLLPPERGVTGPAGGGHGGVSGAGTAAGVGSGAAEDAAGGGRRRRSSLGLGPSGDRLGASLAATQRATGVGGVLLSRSTVMRGGHALPRGMCQYYVFGTVDRCVGVAESTLFLRCQLIEDDAAKSWLYDPCGTSSPSAVSEFSSQLAHLSTFLDHECVLDVDHVFNVPFDYNFVGAALPCSPLRLIVSAFTEGAAAEGIQSAVAYACLSLPIASPGRHVVQGALWAPHRSGVEFLRSVLLGGAPSLVDARQAGPPLAHRTGISVKEGLYADSVGSVEVTVNIMHHKNHDVF